MKHLILTLLTGFVATLSIPGIADEKLDIETIKRALSVKDRQTANQYRQG